MRKNILIVIAFVIMHTITVWFFTNKLQHQCQETVDWAIQDTEEALYIVCANKIDELVQNKCVLPE